MAQSGNRVAVLKLAGLLVGGVIILWMVIKYIF
jgi:hypothetical protein